MTALLAENYLQLTLVLQMGSELLLTHIRVQIALIRTLHMILHRMARQILQKHHLRLIQVTTIIDTRHGQSHQSLVDWFFHPFFSNFERLGVTIGAA